MKAVGPGRGMRRSPAQLASLKPPQKPGEPVPALIGRLLGTHPSEAALREVERQLVHGHPHEIAEMLGKAITTPERLVQILTLLDSLHHRADMRRTLRMAKAAQAAARRLGPSA